ncbi:hypothetical protein NQ315_011341, partial [Exocentrus adspersus]
MVCGVVLAAFTVLLLVRRKKLLQRKKQWNLNNEHFQYILGLIETKIKRQDTSFREAISAKNRLQITLRFLATGETYRSLMYSTRVHESTISRFIPEVCNVIYQTLKSKYLQ